MTASRDCAACGFAPVGDAVSVGASSSVCAGAMLASIGLEALGLGAIQTHTLGITIYWAQSYGAVLREMYWWWAPPVIAISLIFLALFLTSAGMDRFANPKLRRT